MSNQTCVILDMPWSFSLNGECFSIGCLFSAFSVFLFRDSLALFTLLYFFPLNISVVSYQIKVIKTKTQRPITLDSDCMNQRGRFFFSFL